MIYTLYRYIPPTILILLLTVSLSFAMGTYMKTETVTAADISGSVTLFLYGSGNLKRTSILDIEGDDYTFEISDSAHNYIVTKGVDAEQALQNATAFISSRQYRMIKIMSDEGQIMGYELRPLYSVFRYGSSNILDVDYRIRGKTVVVTVEIKSNIRKRYYRDLFGGD
ncbi:MAG: hypothetical protein ABFR82_09610 [Nitrospirota bacterium]